MEEDFGDDAELAAVADAAEKRDAAKPSASIEEPKKVQQPAPQALRKRTGTSHILVSPRQRGNTCLSGIRSVPWEYSDIPADFVLGATTCAFFLSLKYHKLHPDYIYERMRKLGQKYNLRILLTLVDMQNHERPLKELTKTSIINNVTLILCWSNKEAGRYLELYKSYEHSSPTSIKAFQSTAYNDRLVDFVTTPRSINSTDARGLISAFGSIRAAVNARPEEIGIIPGWGEKKIQRWVAAVNEPFRIRRAAKRGVGLERGESSINLARKDSLFEEDEGRPNQGQSSTVARTFSPIKPVSIRERPAPSGTPDADRRRPKRRAEEVPMWEPGEDEEALLAAAQEDLEPVERPGKAARMDKTPQQASSLNTGMAAALAKLRKQ
ncbi:MAG: hypothetical protein LQ346_008447 [Caloplaca aetnensis]|nr:MAG: hypothetical protein LQ346_008447 [Caloplaca aetnensis]